MRQLALGLALIVLGSVSDVPPIILVGLVLLLAEAVRQVWRRRGLNGVQYSRRLPIRRVVVGDPLPFHVTIWNRSALPLAWLRAADEVSDGVRVIERGLSGLGDTLALPNVWSLAPYERVTRHFHAVAERRGVYSLGPVHLDAGDLFARGSSERTSPEIDRWIVRPRLVRVSLTERNDPWGGELRSRRGLIDDPTRYAGVRPWQPGDSVRSIHWRATARVGAHVSRVFERSRHREVVVVLDLQTAEGARWATSYDDDAVEGLCVAAASLVARLRREGAEVGLAATALAGAVRPFAYVAPAASDEQVGRCLDMLARLGSLPTVPVERVLTALMRVIRPGTAVVVLTVRDSTALARVLRRVAASGHPVELLAFGDADAAAARARAAGLEAYTARLDGPWQTASALVLG